MPAVTLKNYLALDVGEVRIGVAVAHYVARIASPLTTLAANADIAAALEQIIREQAIGTLVVGLPRNLSGEDTDQTAYIRDFIKQLEQFKLPIVLQDEALTSRKAEAELAARGKTFSKGDIDALAATYILDDYLAALMQVAN